MILVNCRIPLSDLKLIYQALEMSSLQVEGYKALIHRQHKMAVIFNSYQDNVLHDLKSPFRLFCG